MRRLVTATVLALAAAPLTATSAGAADLDTGLSASPAAVESEAFGPAVGSAATAGRYVAADSPATAEARLDALESGALSAASVSYGPCVLYPSPIRIRTDGTVGTKPQTKCEVPVTSIRHSTDMRYKSFIWWRLKGTRTASNTGQSSLQQKNVGFSCVSSEQTGWGSTTLGTIVYGGRTYYARVYPARVSLSCGG